ncbi:Uncharacterised protein [Mycolicibacterium vanbaalenii]|uniref:Methyltransferase type 11 domain-containing protein n=1 Tax=Mycolicibacterium vanbaalenii TaxID=110539 RepID=A0A5S9QVD4_MYCVN|nr:methyltransferase domain-containing protein [Mycolicibacterium vanbaalenii]CAA0122652.1 Uncharacterised protein [Mycolicibacterium vanbaalenii]
MAELSAQRVPLGRFRPHDLADSLDWLPDHSVDRVLFALAVEYVDDRVRALQELRRVLRPTGALVLSRLHPTGDRLRHGGSYFDVRIIEEVWSRGWRVRYWLAPLQQTCEELHPGRIPDRTASGAASRRRGRRDQPRGLRPPDPRTDGIPRHQSGARSAPRLNRCAESELRAVSHGPITTRNDISRRKVSGVRPRRPCRRRPRPRR